MNFFYYSLLISASSYFSLKKRQILLVMDLKLKEVDGFRLFFKN